MKAAVATKLGGREIIHAKHRIDRRLGITEGTAANVVLDMLKRMSKRT
ncbi:hypothetical protein ALCH109712_16345 [Alkalicoccus chagannorensis]